MDTMKTRELNRRDQDNLRLRKLLLEGAESPRDAAADSTYFESLRKRVGSETTEPSAPP